MIWMTKAGLPAMVWEGKDLFLCLLGYKGLQKQKGIPIKTLNYYVDFDPRKDYHFDHQWRVEDRFQTNILSAFAYLEQRAHEVTTHDEKEQTSLPAIPGGTALDSQQATSD
jgi:hypothetical protein